MIAFTEADGELVPSWLSDRDRPWLRDLLAEARAWVDEPIGGLAERWAHSDADPRAGKRSAMAVHVLLQLLRRTATYAPMTEARLRLFRLVADGMPRAEALARIAGKGNGTALAAQLFADLPANRRVRPDPHLDPSRLACTTNLALVQGMLLHARSAQVHLRGAARAVLRTAWLLGAGLEVHTVSDHAATLRWRRTAHDRSARALASLVPLLPWTQDHLLRAPCVIDNAHGTLVLATGDAILPAPEPRLHDSNLEARFARDFAVRAPGWELLREPMPISLGSGLAFPDFELRRRDGSARWLLEIAGLRDESSLPAKLALLRAEPRLLLCLPARHVPESMRDHPRILPFRRRVIVERVLERASPQPFAR